MYRLSLSSEALLNAAATNCISMYQISCFIRTTVTIVGVCMLSIQHAEEAFFLPGGRGGEPLRALLLSVRSRQARDHSGPIDYCIRVFATTKQLVPLAVVVSGLGGAAEGGGGGNPHA